MSDHPEAAPQETIVKMLRRLWEATTTMLLKTWRWKMVPLSDDDQVTTCTLRLVKRGELLAHRPTSIPTRRTTAKQTPSVAVTWAFARLPLLACQPFPRATLSRQHLVHLPLEPAHICPLYLSLSLRIALLVPCLQAASHLLRVLHLTVLPCH